MKVETIRSLGGLCGLEREWRELEGAAAPRMPFGGFDWALAWWTHLRESKWGVRDTLCVKALRSARGDLVAVAPMLVTSRPGYGPMSIRTLQYFGCDPNVTEVRGMLVRPGRELDAHVALFDDLRAAGGSREAWDWMVLGGVPVGLGVERAASERFPRVEVGRDTPELVLPLPATWDELKARLGRNIKESLRHCYNAPKRDGISPRFEVEAAPDRVGPVLDEFFRLHRARSALEGTIAHKDVFASEQARSFLADVCGRFARRGAFRAFRLTIDGAPVAARLGFVLESTLYLYYSGFDPAFRKYSIMTRLVAEAIRYAIDSGFRTVGLSTGRDVSKTRWAPAETLHRELVVRSGSLRGRIAPEVARRAKAWLSAEGALHGAPQEAHAMSRLAQLLARRAS